jgi:hypothetical protein
VLEEEEEEEAAPPLLPPSLQKALQGLLDLRLYLEAQEGSTINDKKALRVLDQRLAHENILKRKQVLIKAYFRGLVAAKDVEEV